MHLALSQRVSVLGETLIIPCVSENYSVCLRHNWQLNRDHLMICFEPVPQAQAREKDIC